MAGCVVLAGRRNSDSIEAVRTDRDRFVAFAFSAADLLVELDEERRVVYSAGATSILLGADPQALKNKNFIELVVETDRAYVTQLLGKIGVASRIEPVLVQLQRADGRSLRFLLSGYRIHEFSDHFFLSLSVSRGTASGQVAREATRDPATGLVDSESFVKLAGDAMRVGSETGLVNSVTLLSIGDYEEFRYRISTEATESLEKEIGAHLRANSIDGVSAGRLGEDKFSLVHKADYDPSDITEQIRALSMRFDPTGVGVDVEASTVALKDQGLNEGDAVRALAYTVNQFAERQHGNFSIHNLKDSYDEMLTDAVTRITDFREIVSDRTFKVVFQPIVNLNDRKIHHFEALARFGNEDTDRSPFDMITFAEDTGMIGEFDLAMAERVLSVLEKEMAESEVASVAVNMSGRSLGSRFFVDALHAVLERHPIARHKIMFEVTESSEIKELKAANTAIQELRNLGHEVCLDDFGAGAAAFQYLRAFDIDLVKIDGEYVRNARSDKETRAFLRAMTQLCTDLEIDTVAEMVEDEATASFLADFGVKYAQGYLFGRPTESLNNVGEVVSQPAKTARVGRRKGAQPTWG